MWPQEYLDLGEDLFVLDAEVVAFGLDNATVFPREKYCLWTRTQRIELTDDQFVRLVKEHKSATRKAGSPKKPKA